jgi:predicted Zn-dependent peptidase
VTRWICLALAVWLAATGSWAQKTPYDLKYSELQYTQVKPETVKLANGIKVYLLEDHELPVFYGYAMVRTGALYEPAGKRGVAVLTGTLLRTGGLAALSADSLDQELEFMASSVSSDVSREMGEASCFSLTKNAPRTLELFAAVLRTPVFAADKLELERNKMLENVRRRWDDPAQTSGIQFAYVTYGKESPWAALSEAATLQAITRDDLVLFYSTFYVPNNLVLGFCGDFKRDELLAVLNRLFGDWQPRPITLPAVARVEDVKTPGVFFVDKDINQVNIHLGHIGINRFDPNFFKVQLFNEIFGYGGFTCRLMREVRSNKGLAYVVYGGIGSGTDRGLLDIYCQTKTGSLTEAVGTIRDIIKDMQDAAVTDDELARAKKGFINSFVFKFDGTSKVLYRRMYLDYFGYPADYDETYLDRIRAVTKSDIQQAARDYIKPEGFVYVVVGKKDPATEKALVEFGKVTEIKLDVMTKQ